MAELTLHVWRDPEDGPGSALAYETKSGRIVWGTSREDVENYIKRFPDGGYANIEAFFAMFPDAVLDSSTTFYNVKPGQPDDAVKAYLLDWDIPEDEADDFLSGLEEIIKGVVASTPTTFDIDHEPAEWVYVVENYDTETGKRVTNMPYLVRCNEQGWVWSDHPENNYGLDLGEDWQSALNLLTLLNQTTGMRAYKP